MGVDVTDNLKLWAANILAPIRNEVASYSAAFEMRHVRTLLRGGFNPAVAHGAGILGIAEVEELTGDLWHPCEGGTVMATIAVMENGSFWDGGTMTDIIAFDPAQPKRWLLRFGDAWALGFDEIEHARGDWNDSTLTIHATPFDWLQSGMTGCCIVNWTNEARSIIRDMPRLKVHSARYAQALRLELSRPPRLPEITYHGEHRHAA